jgi:hypothetical protein
METPTITASAYTSSNVDAAAWLNKMQRKQGEVRGGIADALAQFQQQPQPHKEQPIVSTARIVKVFIADSNDNLPLDKRVLHSGAEQLTDLTDQELFFEVPIAEILAKHNEVRKATVDKKQAEKFGRDIYLEPARIRDLKMVVVNVAQF